MSTIMIFLALVSDATGEQQARNASAREQQWLYREVLGDGSAKPTAIFLSWDYNGVAFTATCDRKTRELVLRTEVEHGLNAPPTESFEISSRRESVKLRTEARGGHLEGRTEVTAALKRVLQSGGDLEVFIPSEMGEPLYVGRAEPLRRVGLGCLPE